MENNKDQQLIKITGDLCLYFLTNSLRDSFLSQSALLNHYYTHVLIVVYFDGCNATKKRSICSKVKILMCLKCLAYGFSHSAFQENFQMDESTGLLFLKTFCCIVCHNCKFCDVLKYRWIDQMHWIVEFHRDQNGINGMIVHLDCMHLYLKNCPIAWQG